MECTKKHKLFLTSSEKSGSGCLQLVAGIWYHGFYYTPQSYPSFERTATGVAGSVVSAAFVIVKKAAAAASFHFIPTKAAGVVR